LPLQYRRVERRFRAGRLVVGRQKREHALRCRLGRQLDFYVLPNVCTEERRPALSAANAGKRRLIEILVVRGQSEKLVARRPLSLHELGWQKPLTVFVQKADYTLPRPPVRPGRTRPPPPRFRNASNRAIFRSLSRFHVADEHASNVFEPPSDGSANWAVLITFGRNGLRPGIPAGLSAMVQVVGGPVVALDLRFALDDQHRHGLAYPHRKRPHIVQRQGVVLNPHLNDVLARVVNSSGKVTGTAAPAGTLTSNC